jgi:thiol-disulfide isomerase/thioredoxin
MEKQSFRLCLLLALVLCGRLFAQTTGIQFAQGSLQSVLDQARAAHKIVFVDAYTEWCGPCKWMAKTAFPNPEVGAYFNQHFVSLQLDMEKGEGPALGKQYNVTAYPTLLFLSANGDLIDASAGARDAKALLELATKIVKGGFETLESRKAKFEAGERDRQFLYDYIITLNEAGQDPGAVLEAFKPGMQGEAMLDDKNWEVFRRNFYMTTTDQFKYVEVHLEQFKAKFGSQPVMEKIAGNYINHAFGCLMDSNDVGYAETVAHVRTFDDAWANSYLEDLALTRFELRGEWKAYIRQAKRLVDELGKKDAMSLNNYAYTVYLHTKKKKQLQMALAWAEESVRQDPQYFNLDSQAMILYALGRKEAARAVGNAAIEAAKKTGEDYAETEKAMQAWK